MLMTFTSLLHFLNMIYLLLSPKFFCINKIISWTDSMFFKLNPSQFGLIYFSKSSRLIESLPSINITSNLSLASFSPIYSVGFIFGSSLSLIPQIKAVAKQSFFHLRCIKQLELFLDNPTFKLLVSSLVLSHFDYLNSSYYGLPRPRYALSPKLLIVLPA